MFHSNLQPVFPSLWPEEKKPGQNLEIQLFVQRCIYTLLKIMQNCTNNFILYIYGQLQFTWNLTFVSDIFFYAWRLDCTFSSAWSVLFFRFWENRCKTLRKRQRKREIEKDKEREGRQNHMCKCDEYPSSTIIFPGSSPSPPPPPITTPNFLALPWLPKLGCREFEKP
jgi:hypothetical protein